MHLNQAFSKISESKEIKVDQSEWCPIRCPYCPIIFGAPIFFKACVLGFKESSGMSGSSRGKLFDHLKMLQDEKPTKIVHPFLEAFDEFIKRFEKQVQKQQRSNETLKHWRTTRSKVAAFILFRYNYTDISLSDIKPAFADKFYDYLTLEAKSTLSELTAEIHVKKTRQILKTCVTDITIPLRPFIKLLK